MLFAIKKIKLYHRKTLKSCCYKYKIIYNVVKNHEPNSMSLSFICPSLNIYTLQCTYIIIANYPPSNIVGIIDVFVFNNICYFSIHAVKYILFFIYNSLHTTYNTVLEYCFFFFYYFKRRWNHLIIIEKIAFVSSNK